MRIDEARTIAARLDADDPIAHVRERFDIPEGTLYFDGNSLGPLTHASRAAIERAVEHEWRERLIRSWNEDWRAMPLRVGNLIAPLIGAPRDSVICADNTSINLHKTLMAAAALRADRRKIVVDVNNFPTDIYIAASVAKQCGMELVTVKASKIPDVVDNDTAIVTATHVDYRSAHILHADEITKAAHDAGALVVWDLAHTAGAVPIDLTALDTDFAIGCGYKYLNGGPGAPAFVFVAPRILGTTSQPLQGWWAHAEPFDFTLDFTPAPGIERFLTGTPGVIGMKSLEAALSAFEGVTMDQLRAKSVSLTTLFIDLVEDELVPKGLTVGSPRDADHRGSHVALGFAGGKSLIDRLSEQGIVADFRPPDLMRFGFAPLYNTHAEVVSLVENLAKSVS